MKKLNVVKIGGHIVNNKKLLDEFLQEFIRLEDAKILVHGGGNAATKLCKDLGIPIQMVEGRRVTSEESLDVAVMVYAGLLNKNVVAKLQALKCNALGLSGADLNTIPAKKRNHPEIDYGLVGDIDAGEVNTYYISKLMDEGIVPVFPAITHDGHGQLLNTNADAIASALAVALSSSHESHLTYCFEEKGVLTDINDENSLIEQLNEETFLQMKAKGSIYEGMIAKLETAFDALRQGVDHVHIKKFSNLLKNIETSLTV